MFNISKHMMDDSRGLFAESAGSGVSTLSCQLNDPLYTPISASNLESVRKNVLYDNLFVKTAFQAKLRAAGVVDAYLGGDGMVEQFLYGRTQGMALPPGKSVTVTGQQLVSAMKFQEKLLAAWYPVDDWFYDDGSGQNGVVNSGPDRVLDMWQVVLTTCTETIDTMLEMSSYRHGQPSGVGVSDNRQYDVDGVDEALNNGIDVSPFGNVYSTYGGVTRNGAVNVAMNSTPLWLGATPTTGTATVPVAAGTGQIDFNALMVLWTMGQVRGGNMDLGITNVFGFAAIAIALDAQRRDVSNTKHDIKFEGLNFNGVDIYADPLAPSAQAGLFLPLGPAQGKAGNTNLVDGSGSSTQTGVVTSPQYTSVVNGVTSNVTISGTGSNIPSNALLTVGEVLYFFEASSFRIRPSDKPGFDYGIIQERVPFNVTAKYLIQRLATNLYTAQPSHNALAFGFSR